MMYDYKKEYGLEAEEFRSLVLSNKALLKKLCQNLHWIILQVLCMLLFSLR